MYQISELQVIEKKICNALIKDAKPNFNFYIVPFASNGVAGMVIADAVIKSFKKMFDGLWVGGTVYMASDCVIFNPNSLNKMLHSNVGRIEIPRSDIVGVDKEFGLVTSIICIKTNNGILKIRCYGASSFIDKIKACYSL